MDYMTHKLTGQRTKHLTDKKLESLDRDGLSLHLWEGGLLAQFSRRSFGDLQIDLDGFVRIFGAMNNNSVQLGSRSKLIQVLLEMLDDLSADGMCLLPPIPPIWQRC